MKKPQDRAMIPEAHFQTVLNIWNEQGESSTCSIEGNCMSPMIREGDSLVIKHGSEHIRAGDIVVFASSGRNLVCRVVRMSAGNGTPEYLVKADQELHAQLLPRDRIVGKVTEIAGSNGRLCLNSPFWKSINRLLAWRSYFAFRRAKSESVLWRELSTVYSPFRKVIERWPVGRILWGWILSAYRTWDRIERVALG